MSANPMAPPDDWVPKVEPRAIGDVWTNLLLRGKRRKAGERGPVLANLANVIIALRNADEWADVLSFNEFSLAPVTLKPAPWMKSTGVADWTDQEDRLATDWMQHHGIGVGLEITCQAVQTVARDHSFHPVKEYLNGLKWDGEKRLEKWPSTFLGVEPSNYTYAVGARWLISAVARVYSPGCKVDCALILEGPQGLLKSTALKVISEPWFTHEIADLGTKDAALQTHGVWIIELAELESMTRSDVGRVKAFMSRATDRFRPPYGKRPIEAPRQCVFAGSVNHNVYLRDATGGSRFWPLKCGEIGPIDIAGLKRDRDQLWAEALDQFRAGAPWWLDSKELNQLAATEQADRYESDAWQELIEAWSANVTTASISEVLTSCITKPKENWTQADQKRIAGCLLAMGWERYNKRDGAVREWRYRRRS